MRTIKLDIYKGHQPSRHPGIMNTQLVNFFISNNSLVPVAGLEDSGVTIPGAVIRGEFFSRILDGLVIVSDRDVFFYDGFVVHQLGSEVMPGNTPVKIIENFDKQLAFLADEKIIIYDSVIKTFTENTQLGVPIEDVTFQDTFFIFLLKDTNQFKLSEPNNGLAVIPTFTGLANGKGVAIEAFEAQVWFFSNSSINIYYDNSPSLNLYAKSQVIAPTYGCISKRSVAVDFGLICWLGATDTSSPFIAVSRGGAPVAISNENIDFLLDRVTRPEDSIGLLYQFDGHIFYHLYFPAEKEGLIYDFETKRFSLITFNNQINSLSKLKDRYYATLEGKTNLFFFDLSITEDNGLCVNRYVMTPTLSNNFKRVGATMLNCYTETGFNSSGSCELLISRNKGVTFTVFGIKNVPNTGNFGAFLGFAQLGSSYFFNFMLRFNVIGQFALRDAEVLV